MRILPAYQMPYDPGQVRAIVERLRCGELLARALIRRGACDPDAAEAYMHPEACMPFDPEELPDMAAACGRIRRAIQDRERICVYGDYDADGICSTVILVRTLRRVGADVIWMLPSRHEDGYGLHERAVMEMHERGTKLVITVDNGIAAIDEIELAKSIGMDVIVTDHHTAEDRIPDCCAVVCASRKDASGMHRDLCGAGVALQVSRMLLSGTKDWSLYALAAVATIADVVPLSQENRLIVAKGLPHIPENPALKEILLCAGWQGQQLTEQQVAFLICPRLNAAGRVSDPEIAVELLLSDSTEEIREIVEEIEKCNTLRKQLEGEIMNAAVPRIPLNRRSAVLSDPAWNPGVIGIAAARFSEKMHIPVILFAEKDGILTGSGRSPDGIDLYQCLKSCADLTERYGGHTGAAGVTIRRENLEEFSERFEETLNGLDMVNFEPCIRYEEKVRLDQISLKTAEEYRRLAPFGMNNPEPICLIEGIGVTGTSRIGRDGSHLSFYAEQNGIRIRTVAFAQGEREEELRKPGRFDLLARLSVNSFRGKNSLELICAGIRESGAE